MFSLFVFILCAYGLTNCVVYFNGPFHLFRHFRAFCHWVHPQLGELVTCEACSSTWVGIFLSVLNLFVLPTVDLTPFNMLIENKDLWLLNVILDGGFTCGAVWLLFRLEDFLTNFKKEDSQGDSNNDDDTENVIEVSE